MAVKAGTLWRSPVFWLGLLVKVGLTILLVPVIQETWFVPFLHYAIVHPSLDPWSGFLATGGSSMAYPYGPVMLLAHLPGTLLGAWGDIALRTSYLTGLGFRLSLLGVDAAELYLLYRLFPGHPRRLLWLYWWSPIALFVTYWNGQTDIVPVALLTLALLLVREYKPTASGVVLGLALGAKFSMLLAAPFIGIYLWRNKRLRSLLRPFAMSCGATVVLLLTPALLSHGFLQMVFGTPESARVLDLALPLGEDRQLYLTPLLYLLAIYAVWRMRRISFDLLMAATGLSFFLVVLATPAPPGWYLWLVPFLVMHQLQGERTEWLLVGGFSVLLIGLHLFISSGATLPLLGLDPQLVLAIFAAHMTSQLHSMAYTAIASVGLIVLVHMLRERVARNDYFRIAQRPLSLAIAGDSGAGKDTLCRALAGLFGEHSVVHVSGDDYHVWDRFAPMWEGMTHLDPRANDLQRFSSDVLALIDGKAIHCRRYDHVAGRFNRSTRSDRNDVVIASGLHALHIAQLCERFDVRIFLDIDEGLRRSWKVHRDVQQRGHERNAVQASIERRAVDARRYIYPQQTTANLVLRLQPVNARHLETQAPDAIRLKLSARTRDCTSSERVARTLIGLCGLHLDVQPSQDSGEVEMTIEGDVVAEDIALAARTLAPGLQEMLDYRPQWLDGMSGIMQLLVLIQIEEALKRRIR